MGPLREPRLYEIRVAPRHVGLLFARTVVLLISVMDPFTGSMLVNFNRLGLNQAYLSRLRDSLRVFCRFEGSWSAELSKEKAVSSRGDMRASIEGLRSRADKAERQNQVGGGVF